MPRRGRDLEILVEVLERDLAPFGVAIKSPDRVQGNLSKSLREIDVSLRFSKDGVDRLVILECRDRRGDQDVTWIEQLAGKARDVGAVAAIAVSSSGFTTGARNMAQAVGIDLRTLAEVDRNELAYWLGVAHMRLIRNNLMVKSIRVLFPGTLSKEERSRREQLVEPLHQGSKCLIWESHLSQESAPRGSVADLVHQQPPVKATFDALRPGDSPRELRLSMNMDGEKLFLEVGEEQLLVDRVITEVELSVTEEDVPFTTKLYQSKDRVIQEVASAEFDHEGGRFSIDFHGPPNSDKSLTVRRLVE